MNAVTIKLTYWLVFIAFMLVAPSLLLGLLRKTKAKLQNRIGAPIHQPIMDLLKFLRKGETVSEVTSWVFRKTSIVCLATLIAIALLLPWVNFKPSVSGADLFLVIYLFATARFLLSWLLSMPVPRSADLVPAGK